MFEPACRTSCHIDPKTCICKICGRTLTEIQNWLKMPEADRQHTLSMLEDRKRRARDLLS